MLVDARVVEDRRSREGSRCARDRREAQQDRLILTVLEWLRRQATATEAGDESW